MRHLLVLALVFFPLTPLLAGGPFEDHNLQPEPAGCPFDPDKPVVLLVHGYDPGGDDLGPLSRELDRRGYQVVRFTYDWTAALDDSADAFVRAADALRTRYDLEELRVVAHSMGGLVTRRALTDGRDLTLAGRVPVRLLTVASPFGGFESANGTRWMPWNIFGIKESHRSLGTRSDFIRNPGALGEGIVHVKVETDEEGRHRMLDGRRIEDETVTLDQQRNGTVDRDPRVTARMLVNEGHVGILNDGDELSEAMERILDDHGFATRPAPEGWSLRPPDRHPRPLHLSPIDLEPLFAPLPYPALPPPFLFRHGETEERPDGTAHRGIIDRLSDN